ncbi:phosphopantetheine-binding protein [Sorangium sp. So ce375]|uniref:acyl carrier protein n=1 Tax=Sorangium sp. So ce375 TaxID=3133306 RepID=UPI003F5C700E
MSEPKELVRSFIMRNCRYQSLADGDDIFALGLVSSLFAMQLVTFVEAQFELKVDSEDLDVDNFRTVAAIAALVARKKSAAAGGQGA